jgi:hypothetical protein
MSDLPAEDRVDRHLRRLRSDDEAIRIHAAIRLTTPGLDVERVRTGLTEALNDPEAPVRKLAAWALARLALADQRAA